MFRSILIGFLISASFSFAEEAQEQSSAQEDSVFEISPAQKFNSGIFSVLSLGMGIYTGHHYFSGGRLASGSLNLVRLDTESIRSAIQDGDYVRVQYLPALDERARREHINALRESATDAQYRAGFHEGRGQSDLASAEFEHRVRILNRIADLENGAPLNQDESVIRSFRSQSASIEFIQREIARGSKFRSITSIPSQVMEDMRFHRALAKHFGIATIVGFAFTIEELTAGFLAAYLDDLYKEQVESGEAIPLQKYEE